MSDDEPEDEELEDEELEEEEEEDEAARLAVEEWMRAGDPVNVDALPEAADSPFARRLFEQITGVPYDPEAGSMLTSRSRLRARRVWVTATVVLAAAGGGLAYATVSAGPSRHATVACYSGPALRASLAVVSADARGPIADCAAAWAAGHIPGHPPGPAPALGACVLASGTAGVFPQRPAGSSVCATLGLAPVAPGPAAPGAGYSAAVIALRNTVTAALSGSCLDAAQAGATVRRELARLGLSGWSAQVAGSFSSARPCASPGFDEPDRVVYLVAIPRNQAA